MQMSLYLIQGASQQQVTFELPMGYTTRFEGVFKVTPALTPEHKEYLEAFAGSRRMKRDVAATEKLPDRRRLAVGLRVGDEGGYYVGSADDGNFGQGDGNRPDKTVLSVNRPPQGQPALFCQWAPTKDGSGIEWDGVEKFHRYVEWLEYLIDHFLAPWGYKINGDVNWQGETKEDFGSIYARNNSVTTSGVPGA
jgi:hypothetical protein